MNPRLDGTEGRREYPWLALQAKHFEQYQQRLGSELDRSMGKEGRQAVTIYTRCNLLQRV